MSDTQLAAVLAAIATLGGSLVAALRWAVQRVTKSNDDGTTALIANTASNAVLIVKLDNLANKIDSIGDFVEEHTPIRHSTRARTSPHGLRIARPGTHHDEDK